MQFTGAYNAVYTPDLQPCQVLNTNNGTACVQGLNMVQQGPGISQRIGHKVSLKSVRLRMGMRLDNAVAQPVNTKVRVMLLYDRSPSIASGAGAYKAMNNILGESLQANTIGSGTATSNLNPNYFDQIVVLMDKYITLTPFDNAPITATEITGPTDQTPFVIDEFIRLKDLETIYNGTANPLTIANITTGALLLATYGDTAAAAQPWTIFGSTRLRFRDN